MAKSKMEQEAEQEAKLLALEVKIKKLDLEEKEIRVESEKQQVFRRNIEICNSIVMHANSRIDGVFSDSELYKARVDLAKEALGKSLRLLKKLSE